MRAADRIALEELADAEVVDVDRARSLLARLEPSDCRPPSPGAAAALREAELLATALAGLENAFHLAGKRRRRRRSSARTLGRALVVRDIALAEGTRHGVVPVAVDAGLRARWERRTRDIGRISSEVDRAVDGVHGEFLAALPPGPPELVALHEAFAALAADTRGTSRWEAVFGAVEERLGILEREHLRLRARALLGGDPGPR